MLSMDGAYLFIYGAAYLNAECRLVATRLVALVKYTEYSFPRLKYSKKSQCLHLFLEKIIQWSMLRLELL
jgi:hypothetical protein